MPETESQLIGRAFQELINTKHLYQSVEIDFGPAIAGEAREVWLRRVANEVDSSGRVRLNISQEDVTRDLLTELDTKDWVFRDVAESARIVPFLLPPVKTLCTVCDDVTSFNLWSNSSAFAQTMSLGNRGRQVFCLPLQCQGCRSSIVVFMIARNGRKIQLVGRSEFENIKVPPSIPTEQRVFYSQALIAFNCGHFLPALFLIRTLIEQYMRTVTRRVELRGDELCDEYNKTLDEGFKGRFPSFKDVYSNLSEALHRADPNESLFRSELERVLLHFDALIIFSKTNKATKPK